MVGMLGNVTFAFLAKSSFFIISFWKLKDRRQEMKIMNDFFHLGSVLVGKYKSLVEIASSSKFIYFFWLPIQRQHFLARFSTNQDTH